MAQSEHCITYNSATSTKRLLNLLIQILKLGIGSIVELSDEEHETQYDDLQLMEVTEHIWNFPGVDDEMSEVEASDAEIITPETADDTTPEWDVSNSDIREA